MDPASLKLDWPDPTSIFSERARQEERRGSWQASADGPRGGYNYLLEPQLTDSSAQRIVADSQGATSTLKLQGLAWSTSCVL